MSSGWTIRPADLLVDHSDRYRQVDVTPKRGAEILGRTWLDPDAPQWHGLDSYEPPVLRNLPAGMPAEAYDGSATIPATPSALLLTAKAGDPQVVADAERLKELAGGPLKAYSVQEIRQLVGNPRWSSDYVRDVVAPAAGNLSRPVDRKGDEPHLFFAARLAHFMNGCPDGTTEGEMLQAFLERENVPVFWPNFTPVDLCRLRVLYPFIPTWVDGIKSPDAWADHTRFWDSDIAVLAGIPLYDPTLEFVATERAEHGRMKDVALVEASGTFATLVPRLNGLIEVDGMDGHNVHVIAKHYSSSKLLVGAIRAEFGADVRLTVEGALEESKDVVREVTRQIEAAAPGAPKKVIAHVEGVKDFWAWYCAHNSEHPNVPLLGLSHTTSDGRDLIKNVANPEGQYLELMSLSPAKIADERLRFERSFKALIDSIGKSLPNTELYDRPWVVVGFGEIIGPAMAAALESQEIPYVVVDKNPERVAAAEAEGHPTAAGLEEYYDRDPFIVECAGTQVLGREEMAEFSGNPVLISLGSGRYGFDMDGLEEMGKASGVPVPKREVGRLGWLPIVEYQTENAEFTAIADGYVANLAFPEPHQSAYAMTTQLLAWEGMRQLLYNYEHQRPGPHLLRSIEIHPAEHDGGTGRNIHLYPRDIEAEHGANLDLRIKSDPGQVTSRSGAFRIFHHVFQPDDNRPRAVYYAARQAALVGGWDSVEDRGEG